MYTRHTANSSGLNEDMMKLLLIIMSGKLKANFKCRQVARMDFKCKQVARVDLNAGRLLEWISNLGRLLV